MVVVGLLLTQGIVAMVFSKVDFCKLYKFAILHALKYEGFKCLLLNYRSTDHLCLMGRCQFKWTSTWHIVTEWESLNLGSCLHKTLLRMAYYLLKWIGNSCDHWSLFFPQVPFTRSKLMCCMSPQVVFWVFCLNR